MIYVGMDISSKSFVVHAINDKKAVVFKGEIPPTRPGLKKLLGELGPQKKLVVFEAGNQLKWIALTLKQRRDVQLHVVHPNVVKWISQSSGKTDKVDARKLAHLARGDLLPRKVHIVDGHIRQLRELLSARQQLQSKRVALINTIRGYLLQEGKKLPDKFFDRTDWYESLEGARLSQTLRLIIKTLRQSIDALKDSEGELTEQIVAIEDERVDLLESIPGIGKLSSRVLLSALDDARRFDDRKAVAKYGALTPTIHQSGSETHLGHINRDGRHEVRRVLLQCAHTVVRMKSPAAAPLREFFERLCAKRGKKIAVVAVARKLLTVAYGVLKSRQSYDPELLRGQPRKKKPAQTYRLAATKRGKPTETAQRRTAKTTKTKKQREEWNLGPVDADEAASIDWQF
jgi:transposase